MHTVLSKPFIGIGFFVGLMLAVMGLVLFATLGRGQVSADPSQPSAKATAKIGGIDIMDDTDTGPTVILSQDIKTPNGKDLFIDASVECGVWTQTKVESKGGKKDTSTAEGIVMLRAMVDGSPALPGWVTFCSRYQELSAEFAGIPGL